MKAKNIKSVLNKKFNHFLKSIQDETVKKIIKENSIITGGSIASMLLGEPVNDFDIYFKTKEATIVVAKYFVDQFCHNPPPRFKNTENVSIGVQTTENRVKIVVQSAGVASEESSEAEYQYFEQTDPEQQEAYEYIQKVLNVQQDKEKAKPYRPVFLSSNAITLSNDIQLVIRFFGEPGKIHENYDFVHCTNCWTSWDNKLVLRPRALEALLARELRYVGSKYPLCSIIRSRKFIERGWHITAGQYLKMVMQLNEMDLNNVNVLEEQLTGVDVAYFFEVLEALKKRNKDHVDTAYLVELIDRIF